MESCFSSSFNMVQLHLMMWVHVLKLTCKYRYSYKRHRIGNKRQEERTTSTKGHSNIEEKGIDSH